MLLDIWGQWDTGWYLPIAQYGYSAEFMNGNQATYGFFPLYPILMKVVGSVFGSPYIGGILVSNICLFVSCYFLYKLVKIDADEQTAKSSIKYLFLFPTAFIFSAVLSESLFVALAITSFYFARKEKWFYMGLCAFGATLTRSIGIFIIIPLLWEYLASKQFQLKKIRFDLFYFLLIPLGIGLFAVFNKLLTGDALAFMHIQETGWGHHLTNPFAMIIGSLASNNFYFFSHALFGAVLILIVLLNWKKIRMSYWIYSLIFLVIPLMSGQTTLFGYLRYALAAFPIFILCAVVTNKKPEWNDTLIICLALLQGFLMVFWSTGSIMVV